MMKRFFIMLVALLGFTYMSQQESKAQFYSLSSNIPMLGWVGINGEFSATVDRSWSLHADFMCNPFRVEHLRTQNFVFRPQVRYWFEETYRNLFIGLHYIYANYHIGLPSIMDYKYAGWGMGGGLDIGYALPIWKNWNIEFQLGGSVMYLDHLKSRCLNCGDLVAHDKGTYVLPTKAALSLVYLF